MYSRPEAGSRTVTFTLSSILSQHIFRKCFSEENEAWEEAAEREKATADMSERKKIKSKKGIKNV